MRTLVDAHYLFYKWSHTSSYVTNLLYKDKFFYRKIENVNNKKP